MHAPTFPYLHHHHHQSTHHSINYVRIRFLFKLPKNKSKQKLTLFFFEKITLLFLIKLKKYTKKNNKNSSILFLDFLKI